MAHGSRSNTYSACWQQAQPKRRSCKAILEPARNENRLLLTFDKDFGTLSFRDREPAPGIPLFRVPDRPVPELIPFVVQTVKNRDDWHGHLATV